MEPCIVIHGGTKAIPDESIQRYKDAVQIAVRKGYAILCQDGSAVDAVEAAVRNMEDDPVFNAGYGSCVTEDKIVELDAFIMDGDKLATGAVACVQAIANPVSLARRVMEDTSHCLLAGEGALRFAKKIGFPVLENPLELITEESHERSACGANYLGTVSQHANTHLGEKRDKIADGVEKVGKGGQGFDTVGAVALDSCGRLASATSTGGLPNKMSCRVGDTPLVGCGGYANLVAAASTTGCGEDLMKTVLARDVVRNIEEGMNPTQACVRSVNRMINSIQGIGGVIALNKHGEFGLAFSSQQMTWASVRGRVIKYGMDPGEELQIPL